MLHLCRIPPTTGPFSVVFLAPLWLLLLANEGVRRHQGLSGRTEPGIPACALNLVSVRLMLDRGTSPIR